MSGFERVVVIGAGLIGGSIARRLHDRGREVTVVDPDPGTRRAADAAGLTVATVVPPAADLVVLATPLDHLSAAFAEVSQGAPDAVVVDVGSLNGSYVNREPVDSAVLANGDEVQIGKFRLVFLTGPRGTQGTERSAGAGSR